MVNDVCLLKDEIVGRALIPDPNGNLCLTTWADWTTNANAQWMNYRMEERPSREIDTTHINRCKIESLYEDRGSRGRSQRERVYKDQ